jgi:hypothetical protein
VKRIVVFASAAIAVATALVSAPSGAQPSADASGKRVERGEPFGPKNAVSLHPWSLLGPGVALQYERYAFPRWVSVVTGAGFRTSGQADFGSMSFSTALEVRLWLVGHAPFTALPAHSMVGPYFSARGDFTWTRLWHEKTGETIGNAFEHAETANFGHRFVVGPVEITPTLGIGASTQHDMTGMLAAATTPVIKAGLTIGIMF